MHITREPIGKIQLVYAMLNVVIIISIYMYTTGTVPTDKLAYLSCLLRTLGHTKTKRRNGT